jgi:predicted alpha/beta hydrolase family esterase
MQIVYIHGANATATSFNYIRTCIDHPAVVLEYNSADGFVNNLSDMLTTIHSVPDPVFFVAHSLGGIYALHLAQPISDRVAGAVTLSTPYGGSQEADWARLFFPGSQLLRDIGPTSPAVAALATMTVPANWTNIVTTRGASPCISSANDGVVTTNSMRALDTQMTLVELDANHYEVVQSLQTVNILQACLNRVTRRKQC